jgi:hypothetical protein
MRLSFQQNLESTGTNEAKLDHCVDFLAAFESVLDYEVAGWQDLHQQVFQEKLAESTP